MSDETQLIINGLGGRVNAHDILIGKLEVKTERNERDIQSVWVAVDAINCNIQGVNKAMGSLAVKVATISGSITFIGMIITLILTFLLKGH